MITRKKLFLTRPKSPRRALFIGVGAVFLVLSLNQFMLHQWGGATIWGIFELGLVLAGAFKPEATLRHESINFLLKIALWNLVFVVCLITVTVSVDPGTASNIGLWMPYMAALWLLVLGARFASSRGVVIAIAVIASLLLLLQCILFGIGIVLSPYHLEHRTQSQYSLAAALVTGIAFVGWFIRAKLSRPKTNA
jgi:hypothetical protein